MLSKLASYLRQHHLALLAPLGGTSYAAINLPRNSVGSKQIKKNAVASPHVKDRSLRARDFKPGDLPHGPPGAPGAAARAARGAS